MMWPKPARRDKPWNYITLKFQRYTKHLLTTGNLCEHVEIIWGIQFQKRMRQKDDVLDELFQEQVFHSLRVNFMTFKAVAYVNVVELQIRCQRLGLWRLAGIIHLRLVGWLVRSSWLKMV